MKMQVPGLGLEVNLSFPSVATLIHGRWLKPKNCNLSAGMHWIPESGGHMKPLLSCTLSWIPSKGRRKKVTAILRVPGILECQRQEQVAKNSSCPEEMRKEQLGH